jgi:hypothetical protein
MSVRAAEALAEARGLGSTKRASLVNWAQVAERKRRMSAAEAMEWLEAASLRQVETTTKAGPGLARFVRGVRG